jgi:hypothetical protein
MRVVPSEWKMLIMAFSEACTESKIPIAINEFLLFSEI